MFASQNKPHRKLLVLAVLVLLLFSSVAATSAAEAEVQTVTAVSAQQTGGFYYTVQWGDYLSSIAVRYGTTVQAILWANPQIINPNYIYYGQAILIPTGTPTQPIAPPVQTCSTYHYVTYGQNLNSIALWYGISPWAIAQANGLYNLNYIYAGQYLCIP